MREEMDTARDDRPLKRNRSTRDDLEQIHNYHGLNTTTNFEGIAGAHFERLYSVNVIAKIWGVAQRAFSRPTPPILFPEYTKPGDIGYVYRELDFWTSGFFPGCLYLLLERQRKYAHNLRRIGLSPTDHVPHELQLQTTHDLGFMIAPWARAAWELENDVRGYDTVITAAKSLASRYSPVVGCIRSWDTCVTKRYSFQDLDKNFLVIVDNMMNLDMLFWAAAELKDDKMYAVALNHAKLSQRYHVRADFSTAHVVNFDPATGAMKSIITNQGYSDESCWSRGQAWAIAGFTQTYRWTRDGSFLETAKNCADYFIKRLPPSGIPPWDFQAPKNEPQPTDTSAAMIASYGMLLIHEAEIAAGRPSTYLQHALRIIGAVCTSHVNSPAEYVSHDDFIETPDGRGLGNQKETIDMGSGAETILNGATINNYEFAPRRWANHGLVYADYFFLLVGNKLLEMGIGEGLVRG
ncbi:glycoside hydrolase family 88 protein [Hypoxylon trugodes]|uniref:glycoside hydrolase family 88 protein n=1 Tax=Hypoxylon trugodes TaxID=326681 RepID=UPI00218F16F0|nr:glycoside hydrolase family 88 protein [Hypoxylon trugodes]KAI1390411.1 glycoside hydrolase family 88 protein [Hypoxylon trugodes]